MNDYEFEENEIDKNSEFTLITVECTFEQQEKFVLDYVKEHLSAASAYHFHCALKDLLSSGMGRMQSIQVALMQAILNEQIVEVMVAKATEAIENIQSTNELLQRLEDPEK